MEVQVSKGEAEAEAEAGAEVGTGGRKLEGPEKRLISTEAGWSGTTAAAPTAEDHPCLLLLSAKKSSPSSVEMPPSKPAGVTSGSTGRMGGEAIGEGLVTAEAGVLAGSAAGSCWLTNQGLGAGEGVFSAAEAKEGVGVELDEVDAVNCEDGLGLKG